MFRRAYYVEACNGWRGPSLRLSAWATRKRRSGGKRLATVSGLTGQGIERKTSRTNSDICRRCAYRMVFIL